MIMLIKTPASQGRCMRVGKWREWVGGGVGDLAANTLAFAAKAAQPVPILLVVILLPVKFHAVK